MEAKNFDVAALLKMAHSPIKNYVVPGLVSSLIGGPSPHGTVRLFECDRNHQEPITPHSHRFSFQCWVLSGRVRNRIWKRSLGGDHFQASTLNYCGDIGKYEKTAGEVFRWSFEEDTYFAGACYSMSAHEIHSIYFDRGTKVLFFEGPNESNESVILQPWVDGEVIETMEVKPWMFKREISIG